MILESFGLLIGTLVIKVGTDVATNIENRIIDAAIDGVNQKQLPSLTTLGWSMNSLQKQQNEMMVLQIREIKRHYNEGMDFLRYANTTTSNKQKKQFIHQAIGCFTSASNAEVGEAAAQARVFVGACFYALRRIDHTTNVALENGEYNRAFQLAEQSLRSDGKPPRDLIAQLLRLPYLSSKYGTFAVYWKKWEPPKLIEPPKVVRPLFGGVPQLSGEKHRLCVSCGKDFVISTQFPLVTRCSECSLKLLRTYQVSPPPAKQQMVHKTCRMCNKGYDVPSGLSVFGLYCPECRSKSR